MLVYQGKTKSSESPLNGLAIGHFSTVQPLELHEQIMHVKHIS